MKYNADFSHDLEVGQLYERQLAQILNSKKIEVKRDFKAVETGNIFVEYESRNRPSGIATSNAEYYCYILSDEHFVMTTCRRLKALCRPYLKTTRDVRGGDSNTSKGILLPVKALV